MHTTIDSRLQALANQAVHRQMEALQAVADVEWGMSSDRLISSNPNAYVEMRRRVQPFAYFWKTKSALHRLVYPRIGRLSRRDGGRRHA